jgi:Uma2 family endonuclease
MSVNVDESVHQRAAQMPEEKLIRRRMSLEEYLNLPEGDRSEYLDGFVIMAPQARVMHEAVVYQVVRLLGDAFPGAWPLPGANVLTIRDGHRIPDVVLIRELEDVVWLATPPALVVEVLSRSTRDEDLLRKPTEYAEAGIGQYWIIDQQHRTLMVIDNDGGAPTIILELDDDHPGGEVQVADLGTVVIDLPALLPKPGSRR